MESLQSQILIHSAWEGIMSSTPSLICLTLPKELPSHDRILGSVCLNTHAKAKEKRHMQRKFGSLPLEFFWSSSSFEQTSPYRSVHIHVCVENIEFIINMEKSPNVVQSFPIHHPHPPAVAIERLFKPHSRRNSYSLCKQTCIWIDKDTIK